MRKNTANMHLMMMLMMKTLFWSRKDAGETPSHPANPT